MDSFEALAKTEYTFADFLRYYKNIWDRNLVARTIDVQTDTILKAANPDEKVQHEGQLMLVKERLELRKILVQDALDLIAGIDALAALSPEEYKAKCLSKEALAVAADMIPAIPEEPKAPEATPETPATPEAPEAPTQEAKT